MNQWPFLLPHSDTGFFTHAAFPMLRAFAVRNSKRRFALKTVMARVFVQ